MTYTTQFSFNGYEFSFTAGVGSWGFNGIGIDPSNVPSVTEDFLDNFKLALFLFPDFKDFVVATDQYEIDVPPDGILYQPAIRDVPSEWRHAREWFVAELQQRGQQVLESYWYRKSKEAPTKKARSKMGYVYLLKADNGAYKIGKAKDPSNRQKTFGVQLPFQVDFLATIKSDDMAELEANLHDMYDHKRINGEWFDLSDDDVAYIKSLEAGV